jgi:hypothetical protein
VLKTRRLRPAGFLLEGIAEIACAADFNMGMAGFFPAWDAGVRFRCP